MITLSTTLARIDQQVGVDDALTFDKTELLSPRVAVTGRKLGTRQQPGMGRPNWTNPDPEH